MNFKDTVNFKEFFKLYKDKPDRVVFFVGAGLSMPLFPSWITFLKQLVVDTDLKGKLQVNKDELLEKLNKGNQLLEIAEYCVSVIGKHEYRIIMEQHFDKEFSIDDIPNAYRTLLSLMFKSIITTNYDRIPEIGGKGVFSCYTNKNISESLKAIEKNKKIVLKIHGDILNHDSIVLTQEDFKAIINNETVKNGLKSIFSTSTICFLGFGLSDPHFTLILDNLNFINNGQNITHYALLPKMTPFEIITIEKKYGLRIIEYIPSKSNHPEVEEFVNLLKEKEENPLPENCISIDSEDDLLFKIESQIQLILGFNSYHLDYDSIKKEITIHYFTQASTPYEVQKEILSIYKLFDFDTQLINYITTSCMFQDESGISYEAYLTMLISNGEFNVVKSFANNLLYEIDFWKTLQFSEPTKIGDLFFQEKNLNIPFINF